MKEEQEDAGKDKKEEIKEEKEGKEVKEGSAEKEDAPGEKKDSDDDAEDRILFSVAIACLPSVCENSQWFPLEHIVHIQNIHTCATSWSTAWGPAIPSPRRRKRPKRVRLTSRCPRELMRNPPWSGAESMAMEVGSWWNHCGSKVERESSEGLVDIPWYSWILMLILIYSVYIWVWVKTYTYHFLWVIHIHKSQLFWCELQGYKVLTHCHIYI